MSTNKSLKDAQGLEWTRGVPDVFKAEGTKAKKKDKCGKDNRADDKRSSGKHTAAEPAKRKKGRKEDRKSKENKTMLRRLSRDAGKSEKKVVRASKTQMKSFLRSMFGDRDFMVQTYGPKGQDSPLPPVWECLSITSDNVKRLADLSDQGMNVGVVPNVMDGKGRGKANAKRIRLLFADFDNGKHSRDSLLKLAVKPTFIVETSPGRFHAYWRVEGCSVDDFASIQKAVAQKLNSDRSVTDPSRCMRLPGTLNVNYSPPFLAQVVFPVDGDRKGKRIALRKFIKKMRLIVGVPVPGKDANGNGDDRWLSDTQVEQLLTRIGPDDRDIWLKVGQALHSRWPDGRGYAMWVKWSKQSAKFDAADQERTWASFKVGGGVTLGSLVHMVSDKSADAHDQSAPADIQDLAEIIGSTGSENIAFDPSTQTWWTFSGVTWARSRNAQGALEFAKLKVIEASQREGGAGTKKSLLNIAVLRSAVSLAQLDKRLQIDEQGFDKNPELLAVKNGVVDLRLGEFRAATAADNLSRNAEVTYVKDAGCPEFMKFLTEVSDGRDDLLRYLVQLLGYLITGVTREQKVFVLIGRAANGKGTLMNFMLDFLGSYATPIAPGLLAQASRRDANAASSALMSIRGARILVCTEMLKGKLDETFVKQVSGQDKITGREIQCVQTNFLPVGKLLLSTNDDPDISIAADAMWRRLVVLPFDRHFKGKLVDTDLPEKLRAEASGVLNLLVTAAGKYLGEGGGLHKSKTVLEATSALRLRSDSVACWLNACCRVGRGRWQQSKPAYESYKKYVKAEGRIPIGQAKFKDALEEKGFAWEHRRKHNRFLGFEVLDV